MRKIAFVVLILVFFLSACNLPTGQATPDPNDIATRVAATMGVTQQTDNTTLPTTQEAPQSATTTFTPELPTATSTATETITPTATVQPDDPKTTLGNPDFQFSPASSGNPFGVAGNPYEDNSIVISNAVGGLQFASKTINGGKRWRLTSPMPVDFYLEGTFAVNVCSGKDNYGLAMRMPAYDSTLGYFVGLSCDGNYIVDRIDASGNGENLLSWTANPNIKTGSGQVNRLGVMLVGSTFTIYINGVKAGTLEDTTIATGGHFGAYVSARGDPNFTVVMQELLEWDK